MADEPISEKLYCVGRAVVDKSFHTQSGDEAFFGFFGSVAFPFNVIRFFDLFTGKA